MAEADADVEYEQLDILYLDPANPRLGRQKIEDKLSQDALLDVLENWSIEELAVSMLESGFWPQEALIAVKETIPKVKGKVLVVVEGNRRLAALKLIMKARAGNASAKWTDLIAGYPESAFKRLERVPYILKPSRKEIQAYLGFRHVTGIKEWNPREKAAFIAHLIEDEHLTYDVVRKRIGSKANAVRQNYISYRVLLQMEDDTDDIDIEEVEKRFSVLYLSLRTDGVQRYLNIDIKADEKSATTPVPKKRLKELVNFARWLFGTKEKPPLISDSRQVEAFGKILASDAAVRYLERNETPSFAVAVRMAGAEESEVIDHVDRAGDEIEEATKVAFDHRHSKELQASVKRVGKRIMALLAYFPTVKEEVLKTAEEAE